MSSYRLHRVVRLVLGAVMLVVVLGAGSGPAKVMLTGTYRLLAIDGPHVARTVPQLVSGGHAYRLDVSGSRWNVQPGQTVTVTGTRAAHTLAVDRMIPTGRLAAAHAPTGPLSVLVMFASWEGPDSMTQAQADDIIGTQDSLFYAATSYGQFKGFVPTETPWLTIPDPGGCSFETIIAGAETAATAAGYTPSSYDREVVYVPDNVGYCGSFAGMADLPGRHVLIRNLYMEAGVTNHELGHTFGLLHSRAALCTDAAGLPVALSNTCRYIEYGDIFDTMGSTYQSGPHGRAGGLFNALETSRIGWILDPARIRSVSTTQTVTLVPYEDQGLGLHAVSLAGDEGPGTFYLEYRRPIDWDKLDGYPLGLFVHRDYGGGTDLLDMTPESPAGRQDAELPVGRSWTGPFAGDPTITLVSADASTATVKIAYAGIAPGPPQYHMGAPFAALTLGKTPAAPAYVDWAASPGSGVCAYELQRAVNGGAFTTVHLSAPLSRRFAMNASGGTTYQFRVRAKECDGSTSAWSSNVPFSVSLRQEAAGTYAGGWTTANRAGSWGGRVRTSVATGASVTLHVDARNVGVVGTTGPGYGSFDEYVDGSLVATVSTHASRLHTHVIVARWGWASAGPHTIRIVNRGTAGHARIDIDGFVLFH
jgi:hypothetical protein